MRRHHPQTGISSWQWHPHAVRPSLAQITVIHPHRAHLSHIVPLCERESTVVRGIGTVSFPGRCCAAQCSEAGHAWLLLLPEACEVKRLIDVKAVKWHGKERCAQARDGVLVSRIATLAVLRCRSYAPTSAPMTCHYLIFLDWNCRAGRSSILWCPRPPQILGATTAPLRRSPQGRPEAQGW